ncbi:hypothetical protein ASG19_21675 [Rhizobium sp. Leaf306]|uniref:rhamnan synthesis F family protein n=1 Tax=Rhizobium sp. Leaf306 TaxID=1736330 RepID=UPI000715D8A6|nr:rhamnan synthesis F family protein [Rhizobium sp. Leaf306]KQQ33903.1 hypothetical protein ASG19_21675 [Rhizobium sp. Leaf306]
MRRLGIFLFYHRDGLVSKHVHTLIEAFSPHLSETVFVANGALDKKSYGKLGETIQHLVQRENIGYDVWGYKAGIEHIGFERLSEFDEIVFFNYTFFAPVGDLSHMFDAMAARAVDGWGMTAYEDKRKTFLQSYFLVTRRSLHASPDFVEYWETMPMINSIDQSLDFHEFRFSNHFTSLGYRLEPFVHNREGWDGNTTLTDIAGLIEDGMPVVKYRAFNFDPEVIEMRGGRRVSENYRIISEKTDYDVAEIWDYIIDQTSPDDLITSAELLRAVDTGESGQEGELLLAVTLEDLETIDLAFERLARFKPGNVFVATDEEAVADRASGLNYHVRPAGSQRCALLVFYDLFLEPPFAGKHVVQLSDFAQERSRYFFKQSLFDEHWDPLLNARARSWFGEAPHIGIIFTVPDTISGTSHFNKPTGTALLNWQRGYKSKFLKQAAGQMYWPWRGNVLLNAALVAQEALKPKLEELLENFRPRESEPLAGIEAAFPELARDHSFASGLVVPSEKVAKIILRAGVRTKKANKRMADLVSKFRADVKHLQASSRLDTRPEKTMPLAESEIGANTVMRLGWFQDGPVALRIDGRESVYQLTLRLKYNFEDWIVTDNHIQISGWAFDEEGPHRTLKVGLITHARIPALPEYMSITRPDVLEAFMPAAVGEKCGFSISVPTEPGVPATQHAIVFIDEAENSIAIFPCAAEGCIGDLFVRPEIVTAAAEAVEADTTVPDAAEPVAVQQA